MNLDVQGRMLRIRRNRGAWSGAGGADPGTVTIDLVNVRRPGKRTFRLAAERFKDVGDELARYILGVDEEFARRIGV